MIVVGPIGQNVFDISSVSTFYIVHCFHLSMSNAILFVVDLVVDSSPSCNNVLLTAHQYFSGVARWNEPWIHGSGSFQFNIYIKMSVKILTVFTYSISLLLFNTNVHTVLCTEVE